MRLAKSICAKSEVTGRKRAFLWCRSLKKTFLYYCIYILLIFTFCLDKPSQRRLPLLSLNVYTCDFHWRLTANFLSIFTLASLVLLMRFFTWFHFSFIFPIFSNTTRFFWTVTSISIIMNTAFISTVDIFFQFNR